MKKSPLQIVKEQFGGKDKLVEQLVGTVERRQGEKDEEFKARLTAASNQKLLRLAATQKRLVADFGSKEALLSAIVALKFPGKGDGDYKARIAKYHAAKLLDLHDSLKNRKA